MSQTESKYPPGFIKKRKHARDKAMQALYQLQISKESVDWVRNHYLQDQGVTSGDEAYFLELLEQISDKQQELDSVYAPFVTSSMEDHLDPIEQNILRIAAYELLHHLEIPFKVVINEAISLAKVYGTDDSHKFINGVLDPLSKQLRSLETQAS